MFLKKLTKNDYEILRIMVEQGTTNSRMISDAIGISDKTIRNRIAKMREYEIFDEKIVINPEAFGYTLSVDYFIKVNAEHIVEITNWLLFEHKHNISYLGRHWGDDNISIQCVFKDGREAEQFNKELTNYKNINGYDMAVVPIIFKETYNWRPHQDNFNITAKGMQELIKRRQKT